MREGDLDEADRIMRLAFGTFLGLPEPMKFMGDADYIKTRFRADPQAALVAEDKAEDNKIVGSNFALDWGSVGVFGPLTIDPKYWNLGVARSLLESTMEIFEKWGTRHMGLFTFAQSTKHVHLYQKFGFWPRYLTAVMSKEIGHGSKAPGDDDTTYRYSRLDSTQKKEEAIASCARLTGKIYGGLDLKKEIASVENQKLGDTILIKDLENREELAGFAICHSGPGTEAGTGNCYIKFAAVAPARISSAPKDFVRLLNECERYAHATNASRLVGGANTARNRAYVEMMNQGFRTDMQGVAMHRPDEPGYNLPDVYLIDDWR